MIKRIDILQFELSVLILVCEKEQEAIDEYYKYKGLKTVLEHHDSSGWCQSRNQDIYLWAASEYWLLHEIVHAAFSICENRSMKPDEEFIAYTAQYLYREFYKGRKP